MTDDRRSHSGVRLDQREWERYLDISLPCPRNRERYSGSVRIELAWQSSDADQKGYKQFSEVADATALAE